MLVLPAGRYVLLDGKLAPDSGPGWPGLLNSPFEYPSSEFTFEVRPGGGGPIHIPLPSDAVDRSVADNVEQSSEAKDRVLGPNVP